MSTPTPPGVPSPPPQITVEQHVDSVTGGHIAGVNINALYEAARPRVTSLHQLPPIAPNWTGREAELRLWHERLASGETHAAALFGMAGVGKTALAVKLATELRAQYPDAQFFLDMLGTNLSPRPARDALAHVIRGFGWAAGELPGDEAELVGLYRSLLSDKRTLILLDNVREAAQVEPLLPPDGCLLLLTSRWHFYIDGLQELTLEELNTGDAVVLLIKIAPRAKDDALAIAHVCGNLPQALTLAAKWVRNNRTLPPATYLAKCRDVATRLRLTGADVALQVSYDALDETLRASWRRLAVFSGSFDAVAAAPVWGLADASSSTRAVRRANDAALESLNDLANTSLVEWAESTRRYRLHDLARAFADRQLSEEERDEAAFRHAAHFAAVLREIDEHYLRGAADSAQAISRFDRDEANIRAGQAWAESHAAFEDRAARICLIYPNYGVEVAKRRLSAREWIRWLENALAAARKLGERVLEGETLGNLGVAYLELGELERGSEFAEKALALIRQSPTRRGEGTALGNLGAAFLKRNEAAKAVDVLDQALDLHRRTGNLRGEGRVLGNLVTAHLAQNDLPMALKRYLEARAALERSGDLEALSGLAGNLGIAQMNLNMTAQASTLFQQQLALAQQIRYRQGIAAAHWNLAMLHNRQGERAGARSEMLQALTMLEELGDQRGVEDARRQLNEWEEQPRSRDSETH